MSCFAFEWSTERHVHSGKCMHYHYIGLDTLLLSVILSFADGDNLSQFVPRKKALHDSSKMNLQHRSYRCVKMNQHVSNYEMLKLNFSPNCEQVVWLLSVLTRNEIQHICQYLHLDAGNMEQWQWCFFTRAFIGKDVCVPFSTQEILDWGEKVFHFKTSNRRWVSQCNGNKLEQLKKRMIPVMRCSKMICINVQHIPCKCISSMHVVMNVML